MNERICFSWWLRNTWNLKSKFKFQVFPSRQDRKTNSFVCILWEVTARQFCFEIYWPLEVLEGNPILKSCEIVSTEEIVNDLAPLWTGQGASSFIYVEKSHGSMVKHFVDKQIFPLSTTHIELRPGGTFSNWKVYLIITRK